ncbi:MAG: Omp28-related outer membrane protein [Crocinitomicaceae bacterium]|nr:Omp28-related outer membrane protein [Crocinitomicaceae bacterium]
MKKIFLLGLIAVAGLSSCDKVENAYPPAPPGSGGYELYPDGDSTHYADNAKPTFTANANTDRNVMIEDFTGHKCVFCPAAAHEAENIEAANPGRVFISTIHSGPGGIGNFQIVDVPGGYVHDFTCTEGIEIGLHLGDNLSGSPFTSNPSGTISRFDSGSGYPITAPSNWNSTTASILTANDLKVNIQSDKNYYPSTRGLFLHTEVEILDGSLSNELRIVVQLHEDSIIAPQTLPSADDTQDGTVDGKDELYVHREVLRACIDGKALGAELDAAHLDGNGKYYFDYIYELPAQYEADNAHLLIYVRDAVTEEIYQVIKQKIQ